MRAGGNGQRYWRSGPWFLRPETMSLIPGDSPMGYRLPLDSLPWVTEGEYPYVYPADPMAPRDALPPRRAFQARHAGARDGSRHAVQGRREQAPLKRMPGKSTGDVVRTALCVGARNGLLHVFMPPTETAEDYLDLVAAVEGVAADRAQEVVIEGYPPPHDPRLNHFCVTPDPGVIEVNVHPSGSWDELVQVTTTVYDEARAMRLVPEKFMLDGRHVGTGGGNHIVIGHIPAPCQPRIGVPAGEHPVTLDLRHAG